MNRRWLGLLFVLLDTFGTSTAHVCLRIGADGLTTFSAASLLEPWILVGLIVQIAMMPLLMLAYRYGEVVVFFPLFSLAHVWNAIAGTLWLHEAMTPQRVLGTALIVAGCVALAWRRAPAPELAMEVAR